MVSDNFVERDKFFLENDIFVENEYFVEIWFIDWSFVFVVFGKGNYLIYDGLWAAYFFKHGLSLWVEHFEGRHRLDAIFGWGFFIAVNIHLGQRNSKFFTFIVEIGGDIFARAAPISIEVHNNSIVLFREF